LLLRYEGGAELVKAIEDGAAGPWSLRVLSGEDRGALISELVAAAARSDAGGASIVTVPEVRYGSEVLDRVTRSFPSLARLDTGGAEADRARSWIGLSSGWPLGGGGRAAVLAPAPSLRLIVVDEEHHPTYKEDRSPRYDARRVALERARLQGAVCVLVSSTPSLESSLAVQRGTFGQVKASRDLSRAARPIVNTAPPVESALTPDLHHAIRDTLRAGKKVGLLVPRRGYARAVWCASCKRSLRCPRCEAGVVFDRSRESLRCPRCGFQAPPPDTCPTCGAHDFKLVGAGSERLQEQLAKMFPRARVARMDPDVLSARDDAAGESAPPEECDIYVTTWVGTKEALRPPVSLVGVLDADVLIRRPNFRAAEAAYHALAEMSEWAGPASAGGRLVIQCTDPGHHAVQAIVRADHDYFVERELALRSELGYPPYSELIKATAVGPAADDLIDRSAAAGRAAGATVLGPITVREPHVEGDARQVLLKCPEARAVAGELRDILVGAPKGSRLRIDVDPR
jgi:primosomal protein N' (replication factor Y)